MVLMTRMVVMTKVCKTGQKTCHSQETLILLNAGPPISKYRRFNKKGARMGALFNIKPERATFRLY